MSTIFRRFVQGLLLLAVNVMGLLLLVGCGGEDDEFGGVRSDGTIEHPVADTIPYYDRSHISIDTSRTIDEIENPPEAVAVLADYLRDPEEIEAQALDVFISSAWEFHAALVGEGRLVILDDREPRLVEYDLEANEAAVLAEKGQGPGDLPFARDLAREGTSIYVAAPPRRISQFDCQPSSCEFRKMARFDFAPLSLAPGGGATLAALGETPYLPDGPVPEAETDENPVRRVDMEGAVHGSFGVAYRSESWLVRNRMIRSSMIRHLEGVGRYVLAFPLLPYLYVYDEKGELHRTYEVKRFLQPFFQTGGEVGTRVVRDTPEDKSHVQRVEAVEGRWVLLEVNSLIDPEVEDGRVVYNSRRNDYYLVDLKAEQGYYVGAEKYDWWEGGDRSIAVTERGLVLNEDGRLSFLPYEQ